MDLDTDSDSDLEFLAGQAPPMPAAAQPRPAAEAAPESSLQHEIDSLRREMWERLGENLILRTQLENSVSIHERELGNLINQQSKAKDELRQELERQKKEVERERIQIQFLQAELRSKVGAADAMRASSDTVAFTRAALTPGAAPHTSTPTSPRKRYTPAAAAFSDGFVLKKQRILPSTDTSQSHHHLSQKDMHALSQGEGPAYDGSGLAGASTSTGPPPGLDLPALLALVATHRAPGHDATTLELLYTFKLPSGVSLGQRVSAVKSISELVDTLLELVSARSQEDGCIVLLLALLYAFLSRPVTVPDTQKRAISSLLCAKLADWLKRLNPLPPFAVLLPPFALPLVDLRLLTSILYTLDILASIDLDFSVPSELSRRLLTCTQAPQVIAKAISLLCRHPSSATAELVKLINPTVSIRPTVELLFSGLADVQIISAAQLSRELPPSQSSCRLAPSTARLAELQQLAAQQARSQTVTYQSSCIQLALALQYDRSPTPISMHSQVLAVLTGHIDSPEPVSNRIVIESVFFMWCLEPAKLRDELDEDELAELEVCLAKLVYAASDVNDTVERGRQLLQALAAGTDSELVFAAFEPPTHEHVRPLGHDGASSSMGRAES